MMELPSQFEEGSRVENLGYDVKKAIAEGKTALGVEFGSTRIKAVLISEDYQSIASGSFDWENRLEDGIWTYHLDEVFVGLQKSFAELSEQVQKEHGVPLTRIGAIGISGMMHGYLPFDKDGNQLVPFRTWRNTITEQAAELLSEQFKFNIPQRWSIAHLYQAVLNGEPHVGSIAHLTTLAGYVQWKLTGEKVLGVGEASGMFPIDDQTLNYNQKMINTFDTLLKEKGVGYTLNDILPRVLGAGENAGALTKEGAHLLDPTGTLQAGIPLCPPEGDAGTGMVATNSVKARTGNVSAGTSIFAMIVLEKQLSKLYPQVDIVSTPAGKPVAMVHCNNCSSDIDAWVKLFGEFAQVAGHPMDKTALYKVLYERALEGASDCGGLLSYNYLSGEHATGMEEGRPLFTRLPDAQFTLANFMRTQLYSCMATLKLGMDMLTEKEHVKLEQLMGHGGLFKTKGVAQRFMAAALKVPVVVMESAGEGGAWGIALLAAFLQQRTGNEPLEQFLSEKVFAKTNGLRIESDPKDAKGFDQFIARYEAGLPIERGAVDHLK